MAQASKAILPKDVNGPWGKRIGVSLGGSLNWALRVGAYVTERNKTTDWLRYSLVVLNWCASASVACWSVLTGVIPLLRDDSSSTTWNPKAVKASIEFQGMQVREPIPRDVDVMSTQG